MTELLLSLTQYCLKNEMAMNHLQQDLSELKIDMRYLQIKGTTENEEI